MPKKWSLHKWPKGNSLGSFQFGKPECSQHAITLDPKLYWTDSLVFIMISPYTSLYLTVDSFLSVFCYKQVIQCVNWFSEFCEPLEQINETQGRGYVNLWFIAICSEAQVQKHLTLQGACELGGGRGKSPGTETLTRWVCVQVHSVRTGLNCRIPTWCLRGCLTVWKSHTSSIRNIVTKGKIQENFFQLRGIISSLSKVRTHG